MERKKFVKKYPVKTDCVYCNEKKAVDYKEVDLLKTFLSDRGRILSRSHSGICAKHQRRLAKALKRARYLGLLPFLSKI